MLQRVVAYVAGMFRRRQVEAEADDELRFHVEMETDEGLARGLSMDEARRVALRDLGGLVQTHEAVRQVRTLWIEAAWQDLRSSLRLLRRSHAGYVSLTSGVLALAIGINLLVFSIVNALWLRPLPVVDPARVVTILEWGGR